MSCDYTLHCKTCDRVPEEFEMGWAQGFLRDIWRVRDHLIALFDANIFYLEIEVLGHSHCSSDLWEFLREHHTHEVEIQSEYGETEPIEEEERKEEGEGEASSA